jgi:hypothetical protein
LIDIRHCDFLDLDVQDVALILTDPPYALAAMHAWDDLGRFAEEVLRPGGTLAAYSGQYWLPQVMGCLGRHLEYQRAISVVFPHFRRYWAGGAWWVSRWRPILVYSQGAWTPRKIIKDVLEAGEREKRWHPWQQGLPEALYLVERLSRRGDLVVDPFLGSGTVAQACRLLGRRFIGSDVDERAVEASRQRLSAGST